MFECFVFQSNQLIYLNGYTMAATDGNFLEQTKSKSSIPCTAFACNPQTIAFVLAVLNKKIFSIVL